MLSPRLYELLVHRFGDVTIAVSGEGMLCRYDRDWQTDHTKLVIVSFGEAYTVNCPYCGDTRHRLYINHRWNAYDPVLRCRLTNLVRCFNEECAADPDVRADLLARVFAGAGADDGSPASAEPPLVTPRAPGHVQLLHTLTPAHHARVYAAQRGFDPDYLGEVFGVGYCSEAPDFPFAGNRLYIPITMEGELRGWRTRYLGERDWKTCPFPKYYGMPHMRKRQLLYNFDLARRGPGALVICEGPADVWTVGPCAVAVLGKFMSPAQLELVRAHWHDAGAVVVLLDADAAEEAELMHRMLREAGLANAYLVKLPEHVGDPGSCPSGWLWSYIRDCVRGQLPSAAGSSW